MNKVTFTGIDNFVKPAELKRLYDTYPFVEFGFLVSKNNTGKQVQTKYPDLVMLEILKKYNLPLSLHVCGSLAREAIRDGTLSAVADFMGTYFELFSRVQLNVVGVKKYASVFEVPDGKEVIIQFHPNLSHSYAMFQALRGQPGLSFLLDKSGGRGLYDDQFQIEGYSVGCMYDTPYVGFAGGISAENVLDVANTLDTFVCRGYWIDMESRIRIRDRFSIEACEAVCQLCVKRMES